MDFANSKLGIPYFLRFTSFPELSGKPFSVICHNKTCKILLQQFLFRTAQQFYGCRVQFHDYCFSIQDQIAHRAILKKVVVLPGPAFDLIPCKLQLFILNFQFFILNPEALDKVQHFQFSMFSC